MQELLSRLMGPGEKYTQAKLRNLVLDSDHVLDEGDEEDRYNEDRSGWYRTLGNAVRGSPDFEGHPDTWPELRIDKTNPSKFLYYLEGAAAVCCTYEYIVVDEVIESYANDEQSITSPEYGAVDILGSCTHCEKSWTATIELYWYGWDADQDEDEMCELGYCELGYADNWDGVIVGFCKYCDGQHWMRYADGISGDGGWEFTWEEVTPPPAIRKRPLVNDGWSAERAVSLELEDLGYTVEDHSMLGGGYDLKAVKGGRSMLVEVKSSRSLCSPGLTAKEWYVASKEGDSYWLAVLENFNPDSEEYHPAQYIKNPARIQAREERTVTYRLSRTRWSKEVGDLD